MSTELLIQDATCGHCKATIETTVLGLEGVDAASLDIDSKRLLVEHGDAVTAAQLTSAIEGAGYTPEVVG